MNTRGHRPTLILISCSARKLPIRGKALPALELYDGVMFKVVRKAMREGRVASATDVAILSAKYGLIDCDALIRHYDQRLSKSRARELGPSVQAELRRILRRRRYEQVLINLGRDYAEMIRGMRELTNATWAAGPIGKRAAILKAWLSGGVKATGNGARPLRSTASTSDR